MDFWKLLTSAVALYVLLNFLVLPRLTRLWKTNGTLAKASRAGLLAGVEFVRDTSLIVASVYVLFMLVTLGMGFSFGHNARLLQWVVTRATDLYAALQAFKKAWDNWFVLIPLALLVYICWRRQVNDFSGRFQNLVDDEFDRLNRERERQPEQWSVSEPDSRMRAIDQEIHETEEKAAELAAKGPRAADSRLEVLRRVVQLKEQRSDADYERRVNLDPIHREAEDRASRPGWARFLLSRGFFSDLKGFSKLLTRATTVLLTFALIGVAAKAGLTTTVWDGIVRLDELRVDAVKAQVAKDWNARIQQAPLNDQDRSAIRHLAEDVARAILQNPNWQSPNTVFRINLAFQQTMARRAILEHVELPARDGHPSTPFHDNSSAGERQVVDDVVSGTKHETHLGAEIADAEGGRLKSWFGSKWEGVRESILAHAKEYHEPLKMKDLETALMDHIVSSTFDGTLPADHLNEFEKQLRSALKSTTKKAVNDAIITEFHKVAEDLGRGKSYKETINHVRTDDVPVSKATVEDIAHAMQREHMPSPQEFAAKMASDSGGWGPRDGGGARSKTGSGSNSDFGEADHRDPAGPGSSGPHTGPGSSGSGAGSAVDEVVSEIARTSTHNGTYSLPEEAVDALAEYEDHFPRSLASEARTPLARVLQQYRVAGDAKFFARAAELKVARAASFSMLRGFSRVGGVLIGENPEVSSDRPDIRSLNWRIDGRNFTLILSDASGRTFELGPYDRSLIHQALAYSADGRPVAVTMTNANPLPQLKIHLHPSLLDTPLGCRVTELDRLVDTYAGTQLPGREKLSVTYYQQLAVYNVAWSVRLRALADAVGSKGSGIRQRADNIEGQFEHLAKQGLALPDLFSEASIVHRKPEFFDKAVVKAAARCTHSSMDAFKSCLSSEFASSRALKSRDQTALRRWFAGPTTFKVWSGVRERKFKLSSDLAFLRAPAGDCIENRLWPFDFIVQIAFTSGAVSLPENEQDNYVDQKPIEFDDIKRDIARLVASGIDRSGFAPLYRDLQSFAVLQRLFRVALSGNLGTAFPLERLATLTNETAGQIPYFHTARWNGSILQSFRYTLTEAMASQPSAAWMQQAWQRGSQCQGALSGSAGRMLPRSCDFSAFEERARALCPGRDSKHPACLWRRVISYSAELPQFTKMEAAFGVLEDQAFSSHQHGCPAMIPGAAIIQIAQVR